MPMMSTQDTTAWLHEVAGVTLPDGWSCDVVLSVAVGEVGRELRPVQGAPLAAAVAWMRRWGIDMVSSLVAVTWQVDADPTARHVVVTVRTVPERGQHPSRLAADVVRVVRGQT
jgi:hypothetical protein